jgi:hypothetical protein
LRVSLSYKYLLNSPQTLSSPLLSSPLFHNNTNNRKCTFYLPFPVYCISSPNPIVPQQTRTIADLCNFLFDSAFDSLTYALKLQVSDLVPSSTTSEDKNRSGACIIAVSLISAARRHLQSTTRPRQPSSDPSQTLRSPNTTRLRQSLGKRNHRRRKSN